MSDIKDENDNIQNPLFEDISEAELRKMRETAAEGFEINIYNPETGEWIHGRKKDSES